MFKVIDYSDDIDLTEFYREAGSRGFVNNSSKKAMIDCFKNEREFKAWLLLKDDKVVGSVCSHSFDDVMGANSYRILARTCVLGEYNPNVGLGTPRRRIAEHQNITDQFLLPACLSWAKGNVYATSNMSPDAKQRAVHTYYFPTLAKLGIVEKVKEVHYRNTEQTVWQIFPDKFYENLNRYPRFI